MSSSIDEFLDHVDQWKFKVYQKLKRLSPLQRKAFWHQIHEQARARGLHVADLARKEKQRGKRSRRTG
jgi:hypothetical protein